MSNWNLPPPASWDTASNFSKNFKPYENNDKQFWIIAGSAVAAGIGISYGYGCFTGGDGGNNQPNIPLPPQQQEPQQVQQSNDNNEDLNQLTNLNGTTIMDDDGIVYEIVE